MELLGVSTQFYHLFEDFKRFAYLAVTRIPRIQIANIQQSLSINKPKALPVKSFSVPRRLTYWNESSPKKHKEKSYERKISVLASLFIRIPFSPSFKHTKIVLF